MERENGETESLLKQLAWLSLEVSQLRVKVDAWRAELEDWERKHERQKASKSKQDS